MFVGVEEHTTITTDTAGAGKDSDGEMGANIPLSAGGDHALGLTRADRRMLG